MMCIVYAFLTTIHIIGVHSIQLNHQSVDIDINQRYAVITYSFDFTNTDHNPQQLNYQISLDPNAYISYFIGQIDGQKYKGITKEKSKAKQEYTEACQENKNAILVSQDHDANQFSIQTNLQPKSTAILNVTVEQFMVRYFGYYELSLDISNINHQYSIPNREIPIKIQLHDAVGVEEIDIPFGTYVIDDKESVKYQQIDAVISKPQDNKPSYFVLRYKTAGNPHHNQMLFDPKSNTFLHTFSDDSNEHQVIPRRVVFVLDKSGSMYGIWEQAQEAIIGAISNLQVEIDRFGVVLFSSDVATYPIALADNSNTIRNAITFVRRTEPGGSTNLFGAMETAIQMVKRDMTQSKQRFINQIILVTDGQANVGVVDDNQILNRIAQANQVKISIFGIAISDDYGSSWAHNLNYPLIRKLSIQNGGFDKRVKMSDTKRDLHKYYALLQSPQLSEIQVDYQSEGYKIKQLTETKFDALYKGSDIVIAGKIEPEHGDDKPDELNLSTMLSAKTVMKSVQIPKVFDFNDVMSESDVNIERIWAYLQLKQYEELSLKQHEELIDEKALEMALRYKFVTRWTSMIVVEEKARKMIDTHVDVRRNRRRVAPVHTTHPTTSPSSSPTSAPTLSPSAAPSSLPSAPPSAAPSASPSALPSAAPITDPTLDPTMDPTRDPTKDPTMDPTRDPTKDPTSDPTMDPTM
eukprot:19013_1